VIQVQLENLRGNFWSNCKKNCNVTQYPSHNLSIIDTTLMYLLQQATLRNSSQFFWIQVWLEIKTHYLDNSKVRHTPAQLTSWCTHWTCGVRKLLGLLENNNVFHLLPLQAVASTCIATHGNFFWAQISVTRSWRQETSHCLCNWEKIDISRSNWNYKRGTHLIEA
jgi:hypothetical protein